MVSTCLRLPSRVRMDANLTRPGFKHLGGVSLDTETMFAEMGPLEGFAGRLGEVSLPKGISESDSLLDNRGERSDGTESLAQ